MRSQQAEPPRSVSIVKDAPDGNRNVLKSGSWDIVPCVPPSSFPPELLLDDEDSALSALLPAPLLLATTDVDNHLVELWLSATAAGDAVDLSLAVPTAHNQYKHPYLIMESERGNEVEVAAREIDFHLKGRIDFSALIEHDWNAFFKRAAVKLQNLRRRVRAVPDTTF
jgi:hypothetical protein